MIMESIYHMEHPVFHVKIIRIVLQYHMEHPVVHVKNRSLVLKYINVKCNNRKLDIFKDYYR